MRSATECALRICECKARLTKPIYNYPWIGPSELDRKYGFADYHAPINEKVWHIHCKCHRVYVWGWHKQSNGCWRIRAYEPLFDSKQIVVIA